MSSSANGSQPRGYVLGIDVGGSSVKGVAVTIDGRVLAEENRPFDPERPMHFAQTATAVVECLRSGQQGPPRCMGLSAPGLPAADGRSIAFLPNRLPGLEGLDWTRQLGSDTPVPVVNDAQAALLGEVWQGAARGLTNVAMLTLGTGVGGAALVDGRLLRGHVGKAGHLGHMSLDPGGEPDICGTPGSLELAIGNATITLRTAGRFATTKDLLSAHRAGDPDATRIWLHSVRALAAGVVSITNILDPEVIVVGGGIAAAADDLFLRLREQVARMEWQVCGHAVRIVPALLGDKAGAVGAAYHGLQHFSPNPT